MKRITSIILGVLTGFVLVFIGDATTHALNPPPLGLNFMDKNVMLAYVASIPTYILIIMMAFWILSAFMGGMVAGRLNRKEWKRSGLITGAVLMAATLLNLALIPHPVWMWVATLAGYLPAAFIGARMVKPSETIN